MNAPETLNVYRTAGEQRRCLITRLNVIVAELGHLPPPDDPRYPATSHMLSRQLGSWDRRLVRLSPVALEGIRRRRGWSQARRKLATRLADFQRLTGRLPLLSGPEAERRLFSQVAVGVALDPKLLDTHSGTSRHHFLVRWDAEITLEEVARRKHLLALMVEKDGTLFTERCPGDRSPIRIRCNKCEYEWTTQPNRLRHARAWCPNCAGNAPLTLARIKEAAKRRGLECLATSYTGNNKTPLPFRCSQGHEWDARPNALFKTRLATGCPSCARGLGERLVRTHFEQLFGVPFPSSRPRWLGGRKGRPMELDGYSPQLRLAFEHQGDYHYRIDRMYTKTKQRLRWTQRRDAAKRRLCAANGVRLIEVPEVPTRLPLEGVRAFIAEQCGFQGIELPTDFWTKKVTLAEAYPSPGLRRAHEYAKRRHGRCLATAYLGSGHKMLFECREGHRFLTAWDKCHRGHWCPECSPTRPGTIHEMKALAKARGGRCLSKVYGGAHTKLAWACGRGHRWMQKPCIIKRGHWCKRCAATEQAARRRKAGAGRG